MTEDSRPSVGSLIGRDIDGKYSLLSVLGEGGMGAVYKAVTPEGRAVAVKVLHQELGDNDEIRERFDRETQALFALRHPNVLAAHDAGLVDGSPYLVMELLDGAPLDKVLEDGPAEPALAIRILRQILTGLAFAHEQGAAHRDLKSENVFLSNTPDGPVAKLLDFGLVKFTDEEKWGNARKLTVQGSVFGTPAYMAPEQALGKETDTRTDVYSAGCILFELLTGEWPFMEETQMAMLQAQILKKPRLVAETNLEIAVRPELDALIQKAMAKKPADRFANATEMLAALDAIPTPAAASRGADGVDPFATRPETVRTAAPVSAAAAQPGAQPAAEVAPPESASPADVKLLAMIGFGILCMVAGAIFVWLVE